MPAPPAAEWPPWTWWEAAGVLVLFTLAQLGSSLVLPLLITGGQPEDWSEGALLAVTLPGVVLLSHGGAWLLVALLLHSHGLGWVEGLRLRLPTTLSRPLLRPFLLGMVLQVVGVTLMSFFPVPEPWENPLVRFAQQGRFPLLFLAFTAVLLAPFLEEVLFRGLLFPALRRSWGVWPAGALVTVLFTALHGLQTGWYVPALTGITLAGVALVVLRQRTGSLAPAIAFHAGFNAVVLLPVLAAWSGQLPLA